MLEYEEKVTQLGEGFGYRLAIKYTKKKKNTVALVDELFVNLVIKRKKVLK